MEGEEGKCDTELERQNVEELYDHVRHLRQADDPGLMVRVQHEALIPVLRPYQCQAVNWMLKKERYGNDAATQGALACVPSICHESLFSIRSPCTWILSGSTGQGLTTVSQRIRGFKVFNSFIVICTGTSTEYNRTLVCFLQIG